MREVFDNDDIQSILKNGGLVEGEAGHGKSWTIDKIKEALPANSFIIGAYTHVAAENIDGYTLHELLGIDIKTRKMDYKLIKSYINSGVTHFFVDEISFIPSWLWNMLAHIFQTYGLIFIGAGDWGQLPPVKDDVFEFETSWLVKYIFNHNNYTLTKPQRCSNIYADTHALRKGDKIDFTKYKS